MHSLSEEPAQSERARLRMESVQAMRSNRKSGFSLIEVVGGRFDARSHSFTRVFQRDQFLSPI